MSGGDKFDLRERDLLIRLNTKLESVEQTMKETSMTHAFALKNAMDGLTDAFKEFKGEMNSRITNLESLASSNTIEHEVLKAKVGTARYLGALVGGIVVGVIEFTFRLFGKN